MPTPVEVFGQDYFEKIYRHYEAQNPTYKLEYYARLVARWAPKSDKLRILEIGCAFGSFLKSLDSRWEKWGIDISEYAIAIAKENNPSASFVATSGVSIPFTGPFEAIVSFDVLEHVPDLEAVASYVHENLVPGGVFIFVVPVYDGPLGWLVNLLDPDPTHIHKNGRGFWLNWAGSHFKVEHWDGVFRYLLPHGPYVNWPNRLFRHQSPAIAVIARKLPSTPDSGI